MNAVLHLCTRYTVTREDDVVHAVYAGDMQPDKAAAMIREVAAAARDGMPCVLFDINHAIYDHCTLTADEQVEAARAHGLTADIRVAIVGTMRSPLLRELEAAATRRGYAIRLFAKKCTAVAWLKQVPERKLRPRRAFAANKF